MAAVSQHDVQQDPSCKLLLVEDNPGDVRLLREALKELSIPVELSVAGDGQEALDMMGLLVQGPSFRLPDMILLDLNLPKRSGHEVLIELKTDPSTKRIPVVIFSTSGSIEDIRDSYQNHANCYVCKPADLDDYLYVTGKIFEFWLSLVMIPGGNPDLQSKIN